jgi:hypothetical protein
VLVKERVCGDWRVPNSKVMADCELLPRVGDLISHAMIGPVRTLIDAARAYNQFACCPLTSTLYCVQVTDAIKLQPLRAHFGMKNAGSICHRAIRDLLGSAPSADGPVVDPAAMNYSDELAINTDECRQPTLSARRPTWATTTLLRPSRRPGLVGHACASRMRRYTAHRYVRHRRRG